MPYGTSSSYKGGAPAKKKKTKKKLKTKRLGSGMAKKAADAMRKRNKMLRDI